MKQIGSNDPQKIVAYLREKLKRDPKNNHIKHDLAQACHLYLNQNEQAITLYTELLNEVPNHPQVLVNLGYAYLDIAEYDKAMKHLNIVLAIARSREIDSLILSVAHSNIATIYREKYKYDYALHHYLIARDIDSRNHLAERGIAFLKDAGSDDQGLLQGRKRSDGTISMHVWTYPGTTN